MSTYCTLLRRYGDRLTSRSSGSVLGFADREHVAATLWCALNGFLGPVPRSQSVESGKCGTRLLWMMDHRTLSDAYEQLFNNAEGNLSKKEILEILLATPSGRDATILQLSIFRMLFTKLQQPEAPPTVELPPATPTMHLATPTMNPATPIVHPAEALKSSICSALLVSPEFVPYLLGLFNKSEDQFVLFCASKSLRAVLHSDEGTTHVEWLSVLLSIQPPLTLAALYRLQTVTELLKATRKQLCAEQGNRQVVTAHTRGKQEACFHALQSSLVKILTVFKQAILTEPQCHAEHGGAEGSTYPSFSRELWLSFEVFLALLVEALRHESESTDCPGSIQSCQVDIACCAHTLASLVEQSSSLFLMKKLIDMLIKVIDSLTLRSQAMKDHLTPSLASILESRVSHKAIHIWMSSVGNAMIHKAVAMVHGVSPVASETQNVGKENLGLVSTVIRKLTLLLLKFLAVELELQMQGKSKCCPLSALVKMAHSYISDSTAQTGLPDNKTELIQIAQQVLLQMLSEQDTCLIEAMLACCQVSSVPSSIPRCSACCSSSALLETFLSVVNVHSLFVRFLSSIAYDHTVLLDFLISAETRFLVFLTEYLHTVSRDWSGLQKACEEWDGILQSQCDESATGPDRVAPQQPISSEIFVEHCKTETPESETRSKSEMSVDTTNTELEFQDQYSSTHVTELPSAKRPKLVTESEESHDPIQHQDPVLSHLSCTPSEGKSGPASPSHGHSSMTEDVHTGDSREDSDRSSAKSLSGGELEIMRSCSDSEEMGPREAVLDHVMDCLTRLRFKLTRLGRKALTPFPMDSLISLLTAVEELYEQ